MGGLTRVRPTATQIAMNFAPISSLRSHAATLALVCFGLVGCVTAPQPNQPPAGFKALFNGKDLAGWRGGDTFDHRKYLAMDPDKRAKQDAEWTADAFKNWTVDQGELVNMGQGKSLATVEDFGDFELLVDFRISPKVDSGIYLRGLPQVQIWDYTETNYFKFGAQKGSGGLWNNSAGAPGKDPLVFADKPIGQWNRFRIQMIGSRVSIWLNEKPIIDHAILENFYDRKLAAPKAGPVLLQAHPPKGEIRFKNIFIREIGASEATKLLNQRANAGFKSVFNGKDFAGWAGPVDNYEIVDGAVICKPKKGGTIFTKEQYGDFVARVEFKLPPGGNNGLALRYPGTGDTAYVGLCELQILDENYEQVTKSKIDPRQAHGSAYGMAAAQRGYQRPVGEWNFQEVTVKGSKIKVELNGSVILDTDLSTIDPATFMAKSPHPGKDRKAGHFGFAGHSDPVAFRNIQIKKLD